jgi:hypothetical protein
MIYIYIYIYIYIHVCIYIIVQGKEKTWQGSGGAEEVVGKGPKIGDHGPRRFALSSVIKKTQCLYITHMVKILWKPL